MHYFYNTFTHKYFNLRYANRYWESFRSESIFLRGNDLDVESVRNPADKFRHFVLNKCFSFGVLDLSLHVEGCGLNGPFELSTPHSFFEELEHSFIHCRVDTKLAE